jgi:hypothetical protein
MESMTMIRTPADSPASISPAPRRPWVVPCVAKLPAPETRNSIDPIVADGAFSFGS